MAVSGIGSSNTLTGAAASPVGHHKHGGHRSASIDDVGAQGGAPASAGRPASGIGSNVDIKA